MGLQYGKTSEMQDLFSFFFFYDLRNAFLIKQKHRNDRVCLYFVSQKKMDSKTYFGYDSAEIFIFS